MSMGTRNRLTMSDGEMRDYTELADEEGDYSTPSGKYFFNINLKMCVMSIKWYWCDCFLPFLVPNYELSRNLIDLQEIIGYGHFGDVHRGFFRNAAGEQSLVAVKTCKDQTQADKFLEEACKCIYLSRY
jgi:hypothetical protein